MSSPQATTTPVKVLFVCLGNICRSPAAEIIFRNLVTQKGLEKLISIDSAGTSAEHPNSLPDSRMRKALVKRGYDEGTHRARKISFQDLIDFDYVITMDKDNYRQVVELDYLGRFQHKLLPMVQFIKKCHIAEVPDPWYGDQDGFYKVIDLLEDGCEHLLDFVRKKSSL